MLTLPHLNSSRGPQPSVAAVHKDFGAGGRRPNPRPARFRRWEEAASGRRQTRYCLSHGLLRAHYVESKHLAVIARRSSRV